MADPRAPLPPGSTIGILGGGQLGRMLAMAGARLGLRSHIYCPEPTSPAAEVAATATCAAYDDEDALRAFAATVDAVTYEFENVPAASAGLLARLVPVRPGPRALDTAQDRLTEKTFLRNLGIATAPFADVASAAALGPALRETGAPAILKTRRFGYDGKGQARIDDADSAPAAWEAIGAAPALLEGFVPFEAEISVIVARGMDGATAAYDPARNEHRDHILAVSTVPSGLPGAVEDEARAIAVRIVTALDYVGVMGVELFVAPGGGLLVNEIAPRVHNSGHWTLEACAASQFEQHMRAVAGWPLAAADRHSDAEMRNIIGGDADGWLSLAGEQGAALHLYGKNDPRPGRKMGHVTRLSPRSR